MMAISKNGIASQTQINSLTETVPGASRLMEASELE